MPEQNINVGAARISENSLMAEHFYQMWRDNAVPSHVIQPNWLEITLHFIDRARQELSYKAFVAEVEGKVVGSTSCQLFAGVYPLVLAEEYRKYGYIWGVYVESPYRGQGIATQLMLQAITYLKSLKCTQAILHASPSGKPVYEHLGFLESNEMRLDLTEQRYLNLITTKTFS